MLPFSNLLPLAISLLKGLWTFLSDPKVWIVVLIFALGLFVSKARELERTLNNAKEEIKEVRTQAERNQKVTERVIERNHYIVKESDTYKDEQNKDPTIKEWDDRCPIPESELKRLHDVWQEGTANGYDSPRRSTSTGVSSTN